MLHFHFPRNSLEIQLKFKQFSPRHFHSIALFHSSLSDITLHQTHQNHSYTCHRLSFACCFIPLPCLFLQAALVIPHHHIIRTPPLLLHLVTLRKFPYLDFAAIPRILHIIEATPHCPRPLVHYPISVSRTWILSF